MFEVEPAFPEDVDWDAVLQEAKDQTVVALAALAVPEEQTEKWQIPVAQNKMRFFQILDEQTKLVKLFKDADIPMAILKGCAAAVYYPEPLRRTMGDIDFIVPPEWFEVARRLMLENGYIFNQDFGDDRDYSYQKGNVIIELHHHYSDFDYDIEWSIQEGFSRMVLCLLYDKAFPSFPTEITGLILLDHIRHHLNSGLGIRQIIDWMMFAYSFLSDDNWSLSFSPYARRAGLDRFAITLTRMCQLYLGLPDTIKWCKSADDQTALQLLDIVLDSGNFGRKSSKKYRPLESVTVNIRKHGFFAIYKASANQRGKHIKSISFCARLRGCTSFSDLHARESLRCFDENHLQKILKTEEKDWNFWGISD